MSTLDQIEQELSQMTDEEIKAAAEQIQARQARARASMTPERKEKMKEREKFRRQKNAAILRAAKEKNLVPATSTSAVAETASA